MMESNDPVERIDDIPPPQVPIQETNRWVSLENPNAVSLEMASLMANQITV